MNDVVDHDGNLLPDPQRLTRIGAYLRKYSLDELPQLYLILIGKMSFIGPRPLLVEYLKKYPPKVRKRHEVKPGMTGWAQVHGRNNQSWEERFSYDLWYVEHHNLHIDYTIFKKTILQLFSKSNNQKQWMEKYKHHDDRIS